VGDVETAAASLTVTGSSSNPALVPNANIVFGGSGASRTVTVTPLAGQSGSSTITVAVSDGALTASDTFVLTVNAVSTPTYLLAEGFEGTGYENTGWTENGTPNENYTNLVLHGAQSLNCVGAQYIQRSFAFSTSFYVYFRVRWNTWSDYNSILYWDDANYGTAALLYADDNRLEILHGSVVADGTTTIAANTTYHVWVEWTKGTGANGTMKVFLATSGTKPASPEASITTGNGAATQRMYLGPTGSGPNVIFDRLLVDDVPIGNIIDGNQPPTISDIANQTINQNGSAGPLSFTVGDTETAAASLTISGSSSNTTLLPNANIVFGGSGSNRTVTVTPAAGQSGTTTVTVTVSDGTLTASDTFALTVNAVNTPPTISNIADQTVSEDGIAGPFNFTIGDAQTAATSLIVSGSSSNPSLVPNANIVFGGTGANRTVTATPLANQSGTATITVTVSDGSLTTNDTFVLTVSAVNDAPTISDIPNQTINQDTAAGPLSFTIGDLETAAASLTVSGSSANQTLVPNANIVFGGSGANRTVTVTPVTGLTGTAIITVTVSDGALTASDTFTLTVNPVNTPPTISDIVDQTINEDGTTGALGFTVGDATTAAGSLTVTGTSSNPTLVPNANIVFGGSSASRTVTATPAANQFGTATITVTVSDGSLTASDTFLLTVSAVNDAPTISDVPTQTINQSSSAGPLAFTVGDLETAASSLTVSGSSSDQTLVPNANIVLGGSGANRTVTVTPSTGLTGSVTITLTVSDGSLTASDTFLLTVNAVNAPPTISDIVNQTINEDGSTGPIAFTVGDAETAAASLIVGASSSNPALVPNANLVLGGSGASRTISVTPLANQSGTATITVTVSDGSLAASDTFLLTVNAVNDAPTISNVADQTINEDATTGALSFTVGDIEIAAASLTVSGSSSNPTLVPNANIVFGGSGANRTVTITPAANQFGTAIVTITVSDSALTASDTITLTVNQVNDAPTISNIPDLTINQDTNTGPIAFTVGDLETTAGSLTVTGTSSNPTLVPNANIVVGGSGAARIMTVTPAAGQSGTATITVTVSDGALTASDTFVLTVTPASGTPTYLFTEGFEGTGFENTGWTKSGTPNENYTTTVLDGAQSLNCSGAQYIQRIFQYSTSFNLYFRVRWNTWSDYANVIYWDNNSWGTAASLYADDNRLQLAHGSASALGTTVLAANVTYHVWVEWTKGTGSNGTMKLFVSTTGTKPATPEASITNGNGAATERIYVGPTGNGPNVIFDRILVDDVPIPSNP
jgi:VCBS repeat-containing protein